MCIHNNNKCVCVCAVGRTGILCDGAIQEYIWKTLCMAWHGMWMEICSIFVDSRWKVKNKWVEKKYMKKEHISRAQTAHTHRTQCIQTNLFVHGRKWKAQPNSQSEVKWRAHCVCCVYAFVSLSAFVGFGWLVVLKVADAIFGLVRWCSMVAPSRVHVFRHPVSLWKWIMTPRNVDGVWCGVVWSCGVVVGMRWPPSRSDDGKYGRSSVCQPVRCAYNYFMCSLVAGCRVPFSRRFGSFFLWLPQNINPLKSFFISVGALPKDYFFLSPSSSSLRTYNSCKTGMDLAWAWV